jgi:hypothetical protein
MTVFDNLAGHPDWAEASDKGVCDSIFQQVNDFDRSTINNLNSSGMTGLRQYTQRDYQSLYSLTQFGSLDLNTQLSISPTTLKTSFNLTAIIIDTLTAKLASLSVTPQAVTNKGNTKGRKLAEDLNYLLKGLFHKHRLSHLIQLAFRDAMIKRVGYLKVIHDEKNGVKIERISSDEIIIDQSDGYYNDPYKMIHRKAVPIQVLEKLYPEHKQLIRQSDIKQIQMGNMKDYTSCVIIAEAYCKNTYKDKGRHVICVSAGVILDEEWDKDYLPVVKIDYNEPVVGWLGNSVVDELLPLQMEIDRILVSMQAILKIMSVPTWLVDSNAQMNKQHRTNKIGLIWEGDFKNGIVPILHNGAALPPELRQTLEFLIQQGYARAGLTPMDTQGMQKTGSGNQSGEALKTMVDIKSERWQMLQSNFEAKHIELANIILRELQGTKIKVSALDRNIGLREISTKVIPKTHESYVLRMYPVSALPDSIPDLIDSVSQMLQLGVIQPSQVPELFNMPDIDAKTSIQIAPQKLIDKQIDEMLDTLVYKSPEPYHDINYAQMAAMQQYNFLQLNEGSEEQLALLRRYINDVKQLLAQVPPPPAPIPPTK